MKIMKKWFSLNASKVSEFKEKSVDNNKGKKHRIFVKRTKPRSMVLAIILTTLKIFVVLLIAIGFAGLGAFLGIAKVYIDTTPELNIEKIEDIKETSFLYDKDNNLITEFYGFENRVKASIDEIPDTLKYAFIAVEDARFYAHNGIDVKRIFGVVFHNLSTGASQGGSTITQQLIKNSILTFEQTYKRKIQEMYLAVQLEQKHEKDQILEWYLNTIQLGSSIYGVKMAANDYFDKELEELTLRECAIIAGITRYPYMYDPRRNFRPVSEDGRGNPKITLDRANVVLRTMYEQGFISKEEYDENIFTQYDIYYETIKLHPSPKSHDYPYKYFIEYAIKEVVDKIKEENNWTGDEGRIKAMQQIYNNGLSIYTTLDPAIQEHTEKTVYEYSNLPQFTRAADVVSSQGLRQPQVAAVVMDHNNGHLMAIVGGKQPQAVRLGLNRAHMSNLALGSAVKPLAVYGPFIEEGYPGGIIFANIPAKIDGWRSSRGYPENYGGGSYKGPTDVRTGIRKSYNVVAGRIIVERLGEEISFGYLERMGFDYEDFDDEYGALSPSNLALGTHGNSMIKTVSGYSTIANKGVYQEPMSVLMVKDKNGKILFDQSKQEKRQVFSTEAMYILTEWMQQVIHGGTVSVDLGKPMSAAGKTGTNQAFRGVFFGGFTPYYTATVWIGHDDFGPTFKNGSTSGRFAAPLWEEIMIPLHEDLENKKFFEERPENVVSRSVCGVSGMLPNGNLCSDNASNIKLVTELFIVGKQPTKKCDIHIETKICLYSGKLVSPYCIEDDTKPSSVEVFDEDSPYLLLTEKKLLSFLPGVYTGSVPLDELDFDNDDHKEHFCSLHTFEWEVREEYRIDATERASVILAEVEANLAILEYQDFITSSDIKKIDKIVKKIDKYLEADIASIPDTEDDEGYLDELPIFDPTDVNEQIEKLIDLNEKIFDRIQEEIEEAATPEPTVEPTIEPTPSD